MSSTTWDEIKRLAADFQRAQLTETALRLSERNCIEIVQRLQTLQLIQVIHTTDGKSYLTHQEILKEIREELMYNGGRVSLVDIQRVISIDFSHIEAKVNELVKSDRQLHLLLGQLVDESYLDSLAEEVNDKLQEQGQINIAELTKVYDLPTDFLVEAITQRIGRQIHGRISEKNVLFTEVFINDHRAKLCGCFSAVTKPQSLSLIINQFGLQEDIAITVLEELCETGKLAGCFTGKTLYTPDIYTKAQETWADSFLDQNGYIEYDSVLRLGISEPVSFIKKRFGDKKLVHLETCSVGRLLIVQVQAEVEEALSNGEWLDVKPLLPVNFSDGDAAKLLQIITKEKTDLQTFCGNVVVSGTFFAAIRSVFDPIFEEKALKDSKENSVFFKTLDKKKLLNVDDGGTGRDQRKEERRKKAAGGAKGGGAQGRETKTRSVKKKNKAARDDDSDDDTTSPAPSCQDLEFMSASEIEEHLRTLERLQDAPEDFLSELSEELYRPLRRAYQPIAKEVFLKSSGGATNASARRRIHGELREKLSGLWTNARLFEKGIQIFSGDTAQQLNKHMLKTICTSMVDDVVDALAQEHMIPVPEGEPSAEVRQKLILSIPNDSSKTLLLKLHSSLGDIQLKKPDKKKERTLVYNHRQNLCEQLRQEVDAAMILHLTAVVLFVVVSGVLIHAPGKCIPQIIKHLKDHVSKESFATLCEAQDLIILRLKAQNKTNEPDAEGDTCEVDEERLRLLCDQVRNIGLNTKKGESKEDDN